MAAVTLSCPKCGRRFRVLEDEQFDHDCPHCGYGHQDENEEEEE